MAAASRMAWDCISNRPGMAMPRRTPRRPSIGFSSCSRCTASSSSESVSCGLPGGLGHRDLDRQLGEVGQELVQRWVEQAHRDGQPVHGLEDLDEVGPLQRQQLVEDDLPVLGALGQDQPLDELAARPEEHVLGAAQADALGAEPAGAGGIRRVVGVGPHLHPAVLVGDGHQPVDGGDHRAALVHRHGALEVAHHRGGPHGDLPEEDLTGRAVDGQGVALAHDACRRAW